MAAARWECTMRRITSVTNGTWAMALVMLLASAAAAGESRPLSIAQLAAGSNAIVIGEVEHVASGRDPVTDGIYTYVTLQVSEILKGSVGVGPITIKQLGGRLDNEGLMVPGQAQFVVGEQVLVFLEARPRDRTLYTSGLWQGKWSVAVDAVTNERIAFKREPDTGLATAGAMLSGIRGEVSRMAALGTATTEGLNVAPVEQPSPFAAAPFVLNTPPIRWTAPIVSVNIATGAQLGLPSGGVPEINAAIAQWNAAGSSLRLAGGSRVAPRCLDNAGFAGILVTFNDPCNEISDDGNLLALASFGYQLTGEQNIGGLLFFPILDAIITTSANPEARLNLSSSSCFQSTLLHEIGHAIGFDHSADPSAVMYFQISNACFGAPVQLAGDDLAGLFTIYPPAAGGGVPGQPTVTTASAVAGVLNLSWTGGGGAAPTAHRLDFYAGVAYVATLTVGPGTSVGIPIPPGTVGSFTVRVTALNGAGASPPSAAFGFTIGSAGGCVGPPAAPAVTGGVAAGTASVGWPQVPGATAYVVSAGSALGGSNLFATQNVGLTNQLSASGLPAGFQAFVRVIAINACGQSAPTDFLVR
jgi:hypothetical protein